MTHCVQCGAELGVGRFCVNCGHPVGQPPATTTQEIPPAPTAPAQEPAPRRRTGTPWEWILGAAVAVMAVVVLVAFLVGRSQQADDDDDKGAKDRPVELTRQLEVDAPKPAPPNQDVEGNMVRYVVANMLDGAPDTCWRTPGDATGETITITLPRTTEVTQVGLINGYAKVAQDGATKLDWYHGNRRITAVEWGFDDGTTVRQDLGDATTLQTLDVDHVRTDTITLRLLAVTTPGPGPASRDYTAISDLTVSGS